MVHQRRGRCFSPLLSFTWSALVSIYQTDVTSFSQLSIKYKNFENEPNPDPNPKPEPNPNQMEGENHL